MKKIITIIILCLLLTGCEEKKEIKKEVKKEKDNTPIGVVDDYKDLNNTPIGLYKLNGNKLTKLSEDTVNLTAMEDVGIFQVFPSNEESITINSFGTDFYNEWIKYNTSNNLKIGFNIKYELNNGEKISYNVLSPANNFDHYEYFMNYLYDDYKNQGKGFYSHIEDKDLDENTLYTSIKIQSSGYVKEVKDGFSLTVFTYDSEDDFKDGEYRGNSKYTYKIKRS